jgi:peroxiredoxin
MDLGAKQTSRYSPGQREFDNYVIDSSGTVRKVIDGTLRTRAQAKQIIEALTEIEKTKKN